ncbi:hypothetical protein EVAR_93191_1 [Eumeta japonica]|uniref:Uncharacterized protein n=1 Tax=Eumeta variegata TaxID=151549 RepID=A0A4C1TXH7_EUMVA|nr:hypothetical protein EVAR_93191_1 [Eumeta japonica]
MFTRGERACEPVESRWRLKLQRSQECVGGLLGKNRTSDVDGIDGGERIHELFVWRYMVRRCRVEGESYCEVVFPKFFRDKRQSTVARIPAGSTLPSLLIQARTYTPPDIYAPFGVSGLVPFSHCDWLKNARRAITPKRRHHCHDRRIGDPLTLHPRWALKDNLPLHCHLKNLTQGYDCVRYVLSYNQIRTDILIFGDGKPMNLLQRYESRKIMGLQRLLLEPKWNETRKSCEQKRGHVALGAGGGRGRARESHARAWMIGKAHKNNKTLEELFLPFKDLISSTQHPVCLSLFAVPRCTFPANRQVSRDRPLDCHNAHHLPLDPLLFQRITPAPTRGRYRSPLETYAMNDSENIISQINYLHRINDFKLKKKKYFDEAQANLYQVSYLRPRTRTFYNHTQDLMMEPEGKHRNSIMKQRILVVFGLVEIVLRCTLTMNDFQGLMMKPEGSDNVAGSSEAPSSDPEVSSSLTKVSTWLKNFKQNNEGRVFNVWSPHLKYLPFKRMSGERERLRYLGNLAVFSADSAFVRAPERRLRSAGGLGPRGLPAFRADQQIALLILI